MNRVVITLGPGGEIASIASDEEIECYWVDPSCEGHERVYLYQSVDVGPQHVRKQIGGYPVSHFHDYETGKLSPSTPTIKEVE